VLAVLDLHPMLGPASLMRAVAALGADAFCRWPVKLFRKVRLAVRAHAARINR
jgi:hypothetical protein